MRAVHGHQFECLNLDGTVVVVATLVACLIRAAGEEPLPEEDPLQFKPIPEPSPLDGMLITNQISKLCDQLGTASSQALHKLYLVEGVQNARA